jgi:D-sedoheptulose 7-phosphate isomerase
MDNTYIKSKLIDSARVIERVVTDDVLVFTIDLVSKEMAATLKNGGKILICGSGLAASIAENMAASLSGKIERDRPPLNAEALHNNTSFLTGVAAEYGFDEAYARMVLAVGNPGDMLIGISCGGRNTEVLNALAMASKIGLKTIGICPFEEQRMDNLCEEVIKVSGGGSWQRTQECQIIICNIMCEIAESLAYRLV